MYQAPSDRVGKMKLKAGLDFRKAFVELFLFSTLKVYSISFIIIIIIIIPWSRKWQPSTQTENPWIVRVLVGYRPWSLLHQSPVS